jgi:hypothetical protein
VIAVDTNIDRIIIDRVAEAYDALLRNDISLYQSKMAEAIVRMNYGRAIRKSDRPTAVDKVRTICQKSISDMWGWSFQKTTARLQRMLSEYEQQR